MAACAVLSLPRAPHHIHNVHKFSGDGEELLDRLVEACQAQRIATAMASVRERDLTPFSFVGAPELPAKAQPQPRGSPKGRSPRCSPPKAKNVRQCAAPSAAAPPAVPGPRGPRGSLDGTPAKQPAAAGNRVPAENIANAHAKPAAPANVRACPGFFMSPRPSDIPMPTLALLSKAALVRA